MHFKIPPSSLAIIVGAGPNTETGIARILSHPKCDNMAVALLARRQEGLKSARSFLKETSPGCVVEAFLTDTSLSNFEQAFQCIKSHSSFKDLKLKVAKKGTLIFTGTLGKTYLWLSQQEPERWTHELDLRPAAEKF
ncbi:unnamed protein product [Diplocarpon coronariae]